MLQHELENGVEASPLGPLSRGWCAAVLSLVLRRRESWVLRSFLTRHSGPRSSASVAVSSPQLFLYLF